MTKVAVPPPDKQAQITSTGGLGQSAIGQESIDDIINNYKKLQAKLKNEKERLRVTLDSIGDAVIATNTQGHIEYMNPVAEKMTGWLQQDALGLPLLQVFNIINENTRLAAADPVKLCLRESLSKKRSSEHQAVNLTKAITLICRDGSEYGIEDSTAPIRDKQGGIIGVVLVFHDVTAQRLMANEISYRATHDLLTGLLNRTEFEHLLERALPGLREQAKEHALLYINLDQFKVVNDTCGHAAGDKLLKEIVVVIDSCIRTSDTLARLGGDEFGVFLDSCGGTDPAMRIAQQICQRIDEYRFLHDGQRFRIGASTGLVMIDDHWTDISSIMQAADSACFAAKEAGRNRVHLYFDADYAIESRRGEMKWTTRIEQAIEDNQFVLFCQRITAMNKNGGGHGEVLLRMNDGNGGLISPSAFLPAAERFHMASRIDRWVVRELFEWMSLHATELEHMDTISVNLSGQSISDRNFHRYVLEQISLLSLDCSKLCFEITETAAITNLSEAHTFIETMRSHHVRFSLDDFGSGVSSFGYLKHLPVDYLKIDGQFIRGLIDNQIDQATVRCINEVAKVTGKKTIAEWVEDEPVEHMLREMGIDYTQGYLRHRPAPLKHMLDINCSYLT
ncbi:MAG TPA: EAL domain-containing protein [Methylophilaceae bacterium]|nr:EAL domain-containing protein [Methylophilaceae bacterium]